MPEYLAPGVYVEEISTGPKPIEGVGTSTAGFLGMAERGPEYPVLVTSWLDFQRRYGGYLEASYLPFAVQGFFENGGQRCFMVRVVSPKAVAAQADLSGENNNDLGVAAIGRGVWGNKVTVTVELATEATPPPPPAPGAAAPPARKPDWRKLVIRYGGYEERYDNLTHEVGASNNLLTVINGASNLVRLWWKKAPGVLDLSRLDQDNKPTPTPLADGDNGDNIIATDFDGDLEPIPLEPADTPSNKPAVLPPNEELGRGRGLAALDAVDEVALVVVPDEVRDDLRQVSRKVINHCKGSLKDRFAIVSALQTETNPGTLRPFDDNDYAAFYYPWIKIYDPLTNGTRLIPPSGHIAGIYARTDIERGVHKAPANEVVRGALDLAVPLPKGHQEILNPKGVNCIRDFRSDGRGIRVWGARTMSSDPEWKYINVRRLFIFVEESIDQGTQWVVFEPNDPNTWARVVRSITGFLTTVWRSGALMGITQDEAFFVKCDRTTMTQDDIDNGRLICYIGIAPVKPAEFVIFRISQKTAEAPA